MCGISGFQGAFSEKLLNKMNRAIYHRGPDDSGIYFSHENEIGLAHRRLSIIDLSSDGHQPMWDIYHSVVIVFNGEIYNYKDLKSMLIDEGFKFKSHSDTEVIVNLYLRYGSKLINKLNGIFSFAIWDTRTNNLFIARDAVGVKPFYYTNTSNGFLFSSEIKALLQDETVNKSLDYNAIYNYLTYLWSPAPDTILKNVKKLEPGHALIVSDGVIKKHWRYYDLPYDQPIKKLSQEQAVQDVRSCLIQAVDRQMVSDVPVGAFLSGGLDSSSIVALANQSLPTSQKLQCFTIGFNDDSFANEGMSADLPYAQKVANHLGVDLHTIYVGPEMANQLERMIYHLDEPQADPAPLNALFISELARKHDIKVLLSGTGGDDIFSGYRRHQALLLEKYWSWLPLAARQQLDCISNNIPVKNAVGRRINKAFKYASLDGDKRITSYFHWSKADIITDLLSLDVQKSLLESNKQDPLMATLRNLNVNTHPLNKMLYLEGKHFLADHNLNYTDKMGMAVGVEIRVPLLDLDLISLATQLPVSYKQRGTTSKWIFKKAMEHYLPNDVIYRPKTGFGAPLRSWLQNELGSLMADVLSTTSIQNRGIFNAHTVKNLIAADRNGHIDGTYTLFSMICIELWCRIFLDNHGKNLAQSSIRS